MVVAMIELKFNSVDSENWFFANLNKLGPIYGVKLAYQRSDVNEKIYYDGCKNSLVIDSEGFVRNSESVCDVVRTEE